MKKTIAFLCACLMTLSVLAVPAKPGVRTYRQPDGTTVQYIVHGDEYYHFVTDLNGNLMVKNAAGYYVRTGEKPDNARIKARRAQGRMQPRRRMPNTGNVNLAPRGLFILVNFADEDAKFKSSNSLEEMRKMLNEEGYNYDGAPGSVKDYFKAQSGGKYNPQFDVYGPVELPNSYVHYGENDDYGDDMYPDSMVIEACKALEDKVDFTLYDGDNDGEIDFVYIIYAGKGEADTEVEDYIWPHTWSIGDADNGGAGHTVYLDGKLLNTYACGPELNGTSGNRNGIGTLCHEFSHVLGLPDYYDTEYGDNDEEGRTPYSWSPMDAGSYNNDGITPPNWSAYDKYYVGWYTPAILNSEKTVELPADGKTSYCVKLDGIQPEATSTDTVYYLENRQRSGWDEYLPGHGMLIWQVVYDEDAWEENVPNNTAGEPRCTVISASGKKKYIGTGADPFPGDNQKTQWTKYGKKYPVTDIQETLPAAGDSLITFKFMDPEVEIIEGTGSYFEKVTSAPTDWSGTYLIVYEEGEVAFDGSLAKLDAVGNYVNVSIEDDRIEADEDAIAAAFTIAPMESGGYVVKSASGSYIGQVADANGLTAGATAIANTISLGSDGALIAGAAGATLRFNSASNQLRFRYYKKATYANQQPIELYRLVGDAPQGGGQGGDNPGGGDTPIEPTGDEISVADALGIIADLEEGGMTADNYSIVGYVTSIPTAYSSQYNNITLTIADSKEAGAATLTLFRVEPYNDTDIQVAIGDKVLVAGQLQRYVKNGTETPEVAQGGIYSVIEKGEGGGTVTPIEPEGEEVTVAQALEVISGLESGATTDGTYTVTAYVTKIKTAYSSQYNNITLEVADTKDGTQILTLFRVVPNADSDKQVAVGDKVQAVGKLQRYAANGNETPEMAQGGVYSVIEKAEGGSGTVTPIEPEGEEVTVAQALEVISGLESGATTDGTYTVTAYVTKIKTAYSSQYNNITLEVADTKDGTQILTLFRVVPNADSDKQVAVGDKVQAVGKLQRYAANGNETPEMAQGGVYSVIEKAEGGSGTVTPIEPEGDEVTVAQALEVISGLESGATTEGTYTVTAYVTKIKTAYSSQYNNITLEVADTKDGTQILTLFRVVPNADSDKQVAVGDKVQAVGKLQRYAANGNETPEMAQGGVYSVIEKGEGGGGTVTPIEPEGEEVTVEEALGIIADLAENGKTESTYTVTGYIISIRAAYDAQGGYTFDIGDTKDATATLTLYFVLPNAIADQNIVVGDKVRAVGKLQRYVKEGGYETPEMASGGVYSIIEKAEQPTGDEVTVAQALEVIAGLGNGAVTEATYTITGYVTNIKTAYSAQYGNITFEIADTKGGSPVLTLFRVKPKADADVNVAVGDKVRAVGQLQRYINPTSSAETPEMAQGGVYSVIEKGEGGGTVTPVEPEGEEVTVAQALEVISGLESGATTDGTYTVTAYVTKIKTAYSSQYNNITLEVADTKDGTQILTLFRVVPNADSDKQVAVGDKVQAVGKLQRYAANGNETPEMAQGGVYSVIEKAEGGSGTVTPIEPEGEEVTVAQALEVINGLESGATTDGTYTVTAYVTKIKTAYSSQYNNITLEVADTKDGTQILTLFRVVPNADSDKQVAVGDKVQAVGKLQRYAANGNETPEMAQGGVYSVIEKGEGGGTVTPIEPEGEEVTVAQALEVIAALAENGKTESVYTVTGYVTNIKTAYSSQYNNITLEVADTKGGTPILTLFRVKPNADADQQVAVGDKVQAVGQLQRYVANSSETPEMVAGGTFSILEKGEGGGGTVTPIEPSGDAITVAKALETIAALAENGKTESVYTVVGYVTNIKTAYSSQYNNITLEVADTKGGTPILTLFRVKPNADTDQQVAVGDKVQAVGQLQRYVANSAETPEMVAGGTFSILEKGEGGGTTPVQPTGDEISVADAISVINALAENGKTDATYTIMGYVVAITTEYSAQYNNITLTISDTKGGTVTITVFRVKPTADSDKSVAVGDKIVVTGQLQRYVANGKETPETVAGATFSILEKGEGGGSVTPANPDYYQKVTTPITNWAGRYLIVYEPRSLAFNGGLDQLDVAGNSIDVEIENDRIAVTDETKAAEFTIAAYGKGYSIKSKSGRYIGQEDNKNGLKAYKSDEILNLITLDADGAVIKSAGAFLRYNAASNNRRFRYYQSSTYTRQKTVQLYRIMDGTETPVTPDQPTPTGDELTVAQALDVISGLASGATSTADYTVTGYVTNVKTVYSSQYNNITLEIADTKGGSPILTLFRVKPNADTDQTVAVGDKVKATGKLQRYAVNGNETPEMAAGGTYSVIEKGGGTTPTPVNPEGEEVTVTKALEILAGMASGAKTDAKYTVTGYVTSIKDVYSDQYNNISINIADTKGGTDVLLLYRVKPNADADKEVAVGDKVTAVVQLYRYTLSSGDLMETVAGGTYSVIEKNDGSTDTPDPETPDTDPTANAVRVRAALDAIAALAEGGTTDQEYKVVGYVIAITDPFNTQYGNITFTIGDTRDAAEADRLTLFRVKPSTEADKEVKAGDRVVATGKLQRFVKDGKETPEMVAGGIYAIVPETALEDVQFNSNDGKFVINGQLVIIRDGIWYNAQGVVIRR